MTKPTSGLMIALALTIGVAAGPQQAPPPTAQRPVTDQYHKITVTDPYRWLENWNDPEVRAWAGAQNEYTRASLDAQPFAAAVRTRIQTLVTAQARWFSPSFRKSTLFALKFQPPLNQPLLVAMTAPGDPRTERVVVDPNRSDATGATTIDFYVPSQDGHLLAVSISTGGTEEGTVHVFETATGKELPDRVPRVNGGTAGGSVAWNVDDTGFFYTRYPRGHERSPQDRDFYQQIYFHRLGTPTDTDTYSLGKDFPRIAEIQLTSSRDGRFVLASVANGDGGEYAHYLRPTGGQWRQIAAFADQSPQMVFGFDGALYALSHKNAPHDAVIKLSPTSRGIAEGRTIYRAADGGIQSVTPTAGHLYINEVVGGPFELHRTDLDGGGDRNVAIPPVSSVSQVIAIGGEHLLFERESFVDPPAWYRITDTPTPERTTLAVQSSADFSDIAVERAEAISKDGTRVPLTILHRQSMKLDGSNPTILWGYGGYGISESPRFNIIRAVWLEQGGVFAVANLRGGREFGEPWHQAGKLTHKQNVFDDFAACARLLIERRYTSSAKLAIEGGSNGGLLMGASLTQHPDLVRAVVSFVGIYDMLRSELWSNGAFNVTEFGSVKDTEQFKALFAYSPYEHVVSATSYPAVLLLSGTNDPRVNPGDSRRFAARLQAATTSGRPVLLRVSGAGHVGTGLSEGLAQMADVYTFLFWQLGVDYRPVRP